MVLNMNVTNITNVLHVCILKEKAALAAENEKLRENGKIGDIDLTVLTNQIKKDLKLSSSSKEIVRSEVAAMNNEFFEYKCLIEEVRKELDDHHFVVSADQYQILSDMSSQMAKVQNEDLLRAQWAELWNFAIPTNTQRLKELGEQVKFKSEIIENLVKKGAEIVYLGQKLSEIIESFPKKSAVVFSFHWNTAKGDRDLWTAFETALSMSEDDDQVFLLYDLEMHDEAHSPSSLKCYENGKFRNVLQELERAQSMPLAFAETVDSKNSVVAGKKTRFETACPRSYCTKKKVSWQCGRCLMKLDYCFLDKRLYCACGNVEIDEMKFRCGNADHKHELVAFEKDAIADVVNNLKSFDGLTILILGETGVGKSTFINGFANYLQHETLGEAKASETLLSPVKSTFVITNDDFEQITVTTGAEDNESQVIGQSATQSTKAHVFNYKGSVDVRLIDTPGIGDTRGIEQDKENFQNILAYISYYEEIHGICILLKPNNSRLTVMFEFCVKELLTHLHRNAARNIVFCFTNARNTNYRPGDTFPALKTLIENEDSVSIDLRKDIIYCMDNESFRYLAACKHGITFDEEEDTLYAASWEKARTETDRLMDYVRSLEPHRVKDTISVNEVRARILDLTKPLAEIAKVIDVTVANMKDNQDDIENNEKTAEEIKDAINIQVPTLERQNLGHPRTVCTSLNCCTSHKLDGNDVKQFTIHCHTHCYLQGVQADSINNPDLKNCLAMQRSGGHSCSVCGCDWNTHMHVTYEMITVTKDGEDANAKKRFQGITDRIEMKKVAVADLETRIKELGGEKDEILRACAQFGHFLRDNSVLPYNDAMMAYIDLMIKQEREKAGLSRDFDAVNALENLKVRYQSEIDAIKRATSSLSGGGIQISIDSNTTDTLMRRLFGLKHYGDNMRRLLVEIQDAKRGTRRRP